MTVYIELVIIDNFFITYLIAILSYRALAVTVSQVRAVAASVAGTAAAVFYPFLTWDAVWLLAIKLGLCVILALILFLKRSNVLKGGAVFLFVTFLFGGALFAAGLMVHGSVDNALRLPLTNVPMGLIIAFSLAAYAVFRRAVTKRKRIGDACRYTLTAEIDALGKTVAGTAFLDTGNRLYDSDSGLPVIVLNIRSALALAGSDGLKALLEKRGETLHKTAHYIDYSGVSGKKSSMLVLKPDELRLYSGKYEHKIKEVMIGLSYSRFSDAVDYDIILHPAIIPLEP